MGTWVPIFPGSPQFYDTGEWSSAWAENYNAGVELIRPVALGYTEATILARENSPHAQTCLYMACWINSQTPVILEKACMLLSAIQVRLLRCVLASTITAMSCWLGAHIWQWSTPMPHHRLGETPPPGAQLLSWWTPSKSESLVYACTCNICVTEGENRETAGSCLL